MRLRFFALSIPILLLAIGAAAQSFDDIDFTVEDLGGNVHLLRSHAGGNLAALVGANGLVLIDADYVELHRKLEAALSGLSAAPPRYVINTHWHFDHCGGNGGLIAAGSLVMAHKNARERLEMGQLITIIDTDVPATAAADLPQVEIDQSLVLHLNGETIVCMHVPRAHTDGDLVIRFETANVIHTGDLVFYPGYPFIDISSGGSIDGVIAGLGKVLGWCDAKTQIIPGHGPVFDKAGLEAYLHMLEQARAVVVTEIAAGRDLEQIKASQAFARIDAQWDGKQFPSAMFREMVYRSFKKEPGVQMRDGKVYRGKSDD